MKTSRHDAALVEGIYDAAIEPVLWPEVLTRLADDLGCDGLHLLTFNLCGNQPTFGAVGRIDPAAEAEYARDYLYVDFRVPRLLNQPSMQAFLDSGITTEHERNTSPFHNEFLVKYDCRALLCANFALEPNYKGFIAAGRGSKRREFDEPTRTRLGLYLRTLCLLSDIAGSGSRH